MPDTMEVSDLFNTLQGEGARLGRPSTFLRMRRCNLTCSWCDTKYTWDPTHPEYNDYITGQPEDIAEAVARTASQGVPWQMRMRWQDQFDYIPQAEIHNLVVTGGEPLIWTRHLNAMFRELLAMRLRLDSAINTLEFETNGLIAPAFDEDLQYEFAMQFNVSPKMPSAENGIRAVTPEAVLKEFAKNNSYFKIVVGNGDEPAVTDYVNLLRRDFKVSDERVLLMPEGTDPQRLREQILVVQSLADKLGVRVTDRAHVHAFGSKRGV